MRCVRCEDAFNTSTSRLSLNGMTLTATSWSAVHPTFEFEIQDLVIDDVNHHLAEEEASFENANVTLVDFPLGSKEMDVTSGTSRDSLYGSVWIYASVVSETHWVLVGVTGGRLFDDFGLHLAIGICSRWTWRTLGCPLQSSCQVRLHGLGELWHEQKPNE